MARKSEACSCLAWIGPSPNPACDRSHGRAVRCLAQAAGHLKVGGSFSATENSIYYYIRSFKSKTLCKPVPLVQGDLSVHVTSEIFIHLVSSQATIWTKWKVFCETLKNFHEFSFWSPFAERWRGSMQDVSLKAIVLLDAIVRISEACFVSFVSLLRLTAVRCSWVHQSWGQL